MDDGPSPKCELRIFQPEIVVPGAAHLKKMSRVVVQHFDKSFYLQFILLHVSIQ